LSAAVSATVVTVSVELALPAPGVILAGEKVPVAPAGSPETLKIIGVLNPVLFAVAVTVNGALCPVATD
jgi:hypothetical protein